MSVFNEQVGGIHYKEYAIQPAEFIIRNKIPWAEGTVIEYLLRWRDKGGIEDLEKAIHIIQMIIAIAQGESPVIRNSIGNEMRVDDVRRYKEV